MRAAFDLSLSTGWQVERFRREGKSMKSLDQYLDRPSGADRADEGARKLLSFLQQKAAASASKDIYHGDQ